jgi:DNA-directed RNA polymerase specialized sigma24 family protein
LALRLFVALNWSANILLFLSIQCGRCAFEMTTLSTTFESEASTAALSQAELITFIQALGEADKIALMKIARLYARRTPFDHDDLLQEAICRVLSGKRVWARGVPVRSFLVGVMRSIAWEWKSEPHEAVVDAPDPGCGEPPMMASIDSAKIVAMFADDLVAQKIVLGMMEGARGEDLQRSSGLGKVEYESKRKKIRRRIEKLGG